MCMNKINNIICAAKTTNHLFFKTILQNMTQIHDQRKKLDADLRIQSQIWWRHEMAIFSALLAFSVGNHRSPVNTQHKGQVRINDEDGLVECPLEMR